MSWSIQAKCNLAISSTTATVQIELLKLFHTTRIRNFYFWNHSHKNPNCDKNQLRHLFVVGKPWNIEVRINANKSNELNKYHKLK